MSDDLDWDAVQVVPEQGAIAVYTSDAGYVVVRERTPYPEKDACVVFLPQYAEAIVRRIIELAELPFTLVANGAQAGDSLHASKDGTAAERQRRRRNKLRIDRDSDRDDIVTVTGVTATQPPVSSDRAQLVLVRSPAEESEGEIQETALTR